MATRKDARPFNPTFPIYMVSSDGELVVVSDGGVRFVMACATLELGELVVAQFRERPANKSVSLRRVSDRQELCDIARAVVDQQVTHMSWNATKRSLMIDLFDLEKLASDSSDAI